jgi:hypothetical protein
MADTQNDQPVVQHDLNVDLQLQGESMTPDLVREITDKVYALFLADLRIERERCQRGLRKLAGRHGG